MLERECVEPEEQAIIDGSQRKVWQYEGRLSAYQDIKNYILEKSK